MQNGLHMQHGLMDVMSCCWIMVCAGMGRLTGVMDDRGKYIFVSKQEMEAVADYIKVRRTTLK